MQLFLCLPFDFLALVHYKLQTFSDDHSFDLSNANNELSATGHGQKLTQGSNAEKQYILSNTQRLPL